MEYVVYALHSQLCIDLLDNVITIASSSLCKSIWYSNSNFEKQNEELESGKRSEKQ